MARVILLRDDPQLAERLGAVFLLAVIELVEAADLDGLLQLLAAGEAADFIVLDCSRGRPADVDVCRTVLGHTRTPVHIFQPDERILGRLDRFVRYAGQVEWVPTGDVGLPYLRRVLALAAQASPLAAVEGVLRDLPEPKRLYSIGPSPAGPRHVMWEGIQAMVGRVPGVEIVGATTDPEEAFHHVADVQPDGVLLGVDGGGLETVELVRRMWEASPESRVVVFGEQPDYELEAQLAGSAWGYVLWEDISQDAVTCTLASTLAAGLRVLSRRAVEEIILPPERCHHPRREALLLSDEERAVMHGVARDLSARQIAGEIGIGKRTVERHIARLCRRFGVRTKGELAQRARELGFGR